MVSVKDSSILKKISAVIVMITALVFSSFNVFADTPVQPLQVITYSDTSTNVRISGTAERLHYNVDSFQVVFMNPPNNYGTACTPVLVSFRFYNSSDLPAYVGQAEFELTATAGTGAVNTIIYGYDQISTDLFVAESSYSTAEVGRIGIGASNDFAYYTGFVIPPRTSLYFSCIVYVNASAYGQNNTGATEDVNQVTLSNLNLYTNQISFSSDYPYHGEPVNFSPIINAIQDLSDVVSTSSQMTDIINALNYTGNSPTSLNINGSIVTATNTHSSVNYRMTINRYVGKPYYVVNDFELESSNDTLYQQSVVRYPFMIRVSCRNFTNKAIKVYWQLYTFDLFPNNNVNYAFNITLFQSELFQNMTFSSASGGVNFILRNTDNNNNGYIPNGTTETLITGYIDVPSTTPLVWPSVVVNDTNMSVINPVVVDDYYPVNEYYILRDLYLAYSQVNGLDDSSDISNDVADVSDSNHIIEESYYSANASAIEATGLSNYRFTNEQNNGIGSVADDFMLLWNALGSWNGVYIFSLTMALATFIMRHGGLFTIKRETSDKGGDVD